MNILDQFGINPILLAAQVVNFLVLLFILKKLLYKPLLKVLDERKKTIERSLKNAEEIELKLQKISDEESSRLAKATLESEKVIKGAEELKTQIISEAKIHAAEVTEKMIVEAKGQLQMEREKLRSDVMGELGEVVALSLEKIIGRIDKNKQKELIEKSIKELQA